MRIDQEAGKKPERPPGGLISSFIFPSSFNPRPPFPLSRPPCFERRMCADMDVSRPPPLDFPLSLNPTAGGPSSPSSFAPVTRAILPFSLLVNYIGPHSPLSWSRPGSPSSPSTPITASTTTTTTHVSQTASTASPRVRTRSRSRSFRLRSSRSSPVTISSLTESNPPATTSLALSAAPDPPLTPPASPRSRPGQPSLALVSSTLASLRSAPPPSTSSSLLSIADESSKVVKVVASHGRTGDQIELTYSSTKVVGNGSFGVVFAAKLAPGSLGSDNEGDDDVAIKKVLQDKRFKVRSRPFSGCRRGDLELTSGYILAAQNRELQIMRLVRHPNVVNLRAFFYSNGDKVSVGPLVWKSAFLEPVPDLAACGHTRQPKKDEVYLNLVLEYVPETVYRASRHYAKLKQTMPMAYIKLYMYQLMRSLAYIHSVGICHRDIKPQNLLLNPPTGVLKLCDFGSAKILIEGEPNVSYICSRYYRAPELIFGATNYTTNIGESGFLFVVR
jgi:hypothetical protein